MNKLLRFFRLSSPFFITITLQSVFAAESASSWSYFGGSKAFTRYTSLDQINAKNVGDLEILWRRPAVDSSILDAFPQIRVAGNLRSTPIIIDSTLYVTNGIGLAEAFDPVTGMTRWAQQPTATTPEEIRSQGSRGLEYWTDGNNSST